MKRFNPASLAPALVPGQVYEIGASGLVPVPPVATPEGAPDAIAQATAKRERLAADYAARSARKAAAFADYLGQPGTEPITVPDGQMAVTLTLCYDNSDSMTDYFDRHANLSPEFLLLLVKKQGQTEKLARKAMQLAFPEMDDRPTFNWKTEKYSMGHGNYLISAGFELPARLQNLETKYRGGPVTHGHWEIEFTSGHRPILPHRNYGKAAAKSVPLSASASEADGERAGVRCSSCSLSFNAEKSGLELRFPDKPADAVRAELKAAGFRWSRFSSCWYVKDTPAKRAWAEQFVAAHDGSGGSTGVAPVVPGVAPGTLGADANHPTIQPSNHPTIPGISRTKAAWIRDAGQPAGQPGTGTFACACGQKVAASFRAADGDVTCAHCGQVYAWDGWLKSETGNRKPEMKSERVPQIAPLPGGTPLGMNDSTLQPFQPFNPSTIPAWRQRFAHR